MDSLEQKIKQIGLEAGAGDIRMTTRERLVKGPPSADPSYVMPEAKSVICFLVPLDGKAIRKFLAKEDQDCMGKVQNDAFRSLVRIGRALTKFLQAEGFKAVDPAPNFIYKPKSNLMRGLEPNFSHRYGAITSGLGVPGWSGNLMTEKYGARVNLGSIITDAELQPDEPLDKDLCDDCRSCVAVCPTGFFSGQEDMTVEIGQHEYNYSKRSVHMRCALCCAGFSGLSRNKKWSTWSMGRYNIPKDDSKLLPLYYRIIEDLQKTIAEGKMTKFDPSPSALEKKKTDFDRREPSRPPTCGNCQLVCAPTREEREELLKLLHSSGAAVSDEQGGRKIVPAKESKDIPAL